jgi:hypothetical protein
VTELPTSAPARRKKSLVRKRITVPGNLRRGCDDFNRGKFFECHESFEDIWQQEQGRVRDLYKGLIQVAAAFVHITRGNFAGAERLLRTGLGYLQPYRADGAMGFDVDGVCRATEAAHREVLALGPGGLASFDFALTPNYQFDEQLLACEAVRWGAWGFDGSGGALEMEIVVAE